jgi:hypothetical protein
MELTRNKKHTEMQKYRWEFMRQDTDYRKAYEKALNLRSTFLKHVTAGEEETELTEDHIQTYLSSRLGQEEERLCDEVGLYSSCMINPDKSYDDLKDGPDDMEKAYFFGQLFWSHYATIKSEGTHLIIDLDFSKINSFAALKKELAKLIDVQGKRLYMPYMKKHYEPESKKGRKAATDYGRLLDIGHLREKEKLTFIKIAERISPAQYKKDDQEIARKQANEGYKQYKELVDGRYRDLTYP